MSRPVESPALQPKRVRFEPSTSDEATRASNNIADDDSDSGSELSESSEDPSSESSSEDEDEDAALDVEMTEQKGRDGVVNLRAGQGKKPTMKLRKHEQGPDLRAFLKDFLPKLKAANDELESQRKAGTLKSREIDMTDADDAEQYIEMVGLVLSCQNAHS
jgi:hypothetical protein